MPGTIVQGIAEWLFHVFLEFVCYFIGRMVVPVVSFGRWKCDGITANAPRRKLRAAGIYHRRGQQVYLTAEATQGVGLLTVGLLVGGGILIWHLKRG